MLRGEVWIGTDAEAVAEEAARRFVEIAQRSVAERGRCAVSLAGGSTPKAMLAILARAPSALPMKQLELYFGDERCVPPDHPDSNYRMTKEAFLDPVSFPPAQVHRIECELSPNMAARNYQTVLATRVSSNPRSLPRFDLMLLGMGPDGHTASLFPNSKGLAERTHWVTENFAPAQSKWRVTLTYPVLCAARSILVATGGKEKTDVLARIAHAPASPSEYLLKELPILGVQPMAPDTRMAWLIDAAAAGIAVTPKLE